MSRVHRNGCIGNAAVRSDESDSLSRSSQLRSKGVTFAPRSPLSAAGTSMCLGCTPRWSLRTWRASAATHRVWLLAVGVAMLLSGISSAQAGSSSSIPRTPDGHPNFEGTWVNVTLTPLERPPEVGGKAFYTPEEFPRAEARAQQWAEKLYRPDSGVGTDNEAFFEKDRHLLPTRQTSLVVDPADGRVPLRPELAARSDTHAYSLDSYETMSPLERCISIGPTILLPKFINNGYQIVQTADQFAVHAEMMDNARVIALHAMPAPDPRIKEWAGISRAHWEHDTLVIETTNFNDRGYIVTSISQGSSRNIRQTHQLRTIERLTLTDRDTIDYRITFEDPETFTQAWTIEFPFHRANQYRMYEFACHEGNKDIEITLQGARVQEGQLKTE
jgi:hypothetical protein